MKHYLICNHCSHPNEIKSEYMVLCSHCGKRMNNNFTEWKLSNAGKSFDEYKMSVGITDQQISATQPEKKKKGSFKSRSLKEKIIIVVITVVSANIGAWLGSAALKSIQNGKKTEAFSDSQWVRRTYGDFGLSLEAPWILIPWREALPLETQVESLIEQMQMFENPTEDFKVITSSVKYKPEIGEVNFRGGADGAINGMKNVEGVTDFVYDEKPYSLGNIPGVIQKGNYKLNNINIEFINVMLMQDLNAWQVNILYKPDDDVAKKAAERIVKSIKVE